MKYNFSFVSKNLEETKKLGELLGSELIAGSVIGLTGNLGSGKTVFTQGIAKGLNVDEPNSPTFVIMRSYDGEIPLYHFDVYRLESSAEFEEIGYEEFIYGNGVSVIEWADKINDVLPDNTVIIEISIFEKDVENSRIIKIKGNEEWLLSFKSMAEQVFQT